MSEDTLLQPNLSTSALITIDVQRDTLDAAPAEVPGTSSVLPSMVELARSFRRVQQPIVHIVRLYLKDGSNVDLCRRRMVKAGASIFIAGSPGAQLADGMVPSATPLDTRALLAGEAQAIGRNEVAIYKPRWGAFFQTPLQSHLEALGVDTLVFCGVNFPNCPRTSIYEASERDYRIVVARDAVSRLSQDGIEELTNIGVSVWTVEHVRRELVAARAREGV